MACISKLAAGFAYDCDTGATGIESAIIINKEDIASFSFNPTIKSIVDSITLVSGAVAYKIDTPKRSLVLSESLKVNEGAPNAYSHAATLIQTSALDSSAAAGVLRINTLWSIPNGAYVIIAREGPTTNRIYGLYYGMSATGVERTTHDNGGWYTINLATPEQVLGEDSLLCPTVMYQSMYAAAVY